MTVITKFVAVKASGVKAMVCFYQIFDYSGVGLFQNLLNCNFFELLDTILKKYRDI